MNEVYVIDGVAHETLTGNLVYVRCGARLPARLEPSKVHKDRPVTCLLCLGYVEPAGDPPENDNDDDSYPPYGYGYADEDGAIYDDDDD